MELKYSEQARILLKSMSGFDKEAFEKWFTDNLSIGSNNILMYLMDEEKKLKNKIVIPTKR